MRWRLPEPSDQPLSRQTERACAVLLGAGWTMLVPAAILGPEDPLGRQLMLGSSACMATLMAPLGYCVVQGIRWLRRSQM